MASRPMVFGDYHCVKESPVPRRVNYDVLRLVLRECEFRRRAHSLIGYTAVQPVLIRVSNMRPV